MKRQFLSEQADELLALVERDRSAPHYTETGFERKLIRSDRRARGLKPKPLMRPSSYLQEREWLEICDRAELTESQWEIMKMRFEGHTFVHIGEKRGTSKQAAMNIYLRAAKKLIQAWQSYPYLGLPESYEEDVNRGAPWR
ncbi:MAG: hypothetical protein MH204_02545 [Fimbriimonadaceae bacterium]|nr:hypothetical protein [Fimbriimonadaceae bacterium]